MTAKETSASSGYIPPYSFAFVDMKEALLHYIAALCSVECARFLMYIDTHPSKKNSHLSQFLSPYTLADWAVGNIEESAWKDRGSDAKKNLSRWAMAMIEFNTLFRAKGVTDPIGFVEEKGFVIKEKEGFGWAANHEKIKNLLNVTY